MSFSLRTGTVQSKDDMKLDESRIDPYQQSKPRAWMGFWKVQIPQTPHGRATLRAFFIECVHQSLCLQWRSKLVPRKGNMKRTIGVPIQIQRCTWLSLHTFSPLKWTDRTLQQRRHLSIQVLCAKPVNPSQQHRRSTPNLLQAYEEILSMLGPESCNIIPALFSINLEHYIPNQKVWAFTISYPTRGSLLIWCLLFDVCTNILRHWTLDEETSVAPRLVELRTIQRCNHATQANGQL